MIVNRGTTNFKNTQSIKYNNCCCVSADCHRVQYVLRLCKRACKCTSCTFRNTQSIRYLQKHTIHKVQQVHLQSAATQHLLYLMELRLCRLPTRLAMFSEKNWMFFFLYNKCCCVSADCQRDWLCFQKKNWIFFSLYSKCCPVSSGTRTWVSPEWKCFQKTWSVPLAVQREPAAGTAPHGPITLSIINMNTYIYIYICVCMGDWMLGSSDRMQGVLNGMFQFRTLNWIQEDRRVGFLDWILGSFDRIQNF